MSRVYQLLALSIAAALVEVVGIGSIAPFIATLTNPELIDTNPYLNEAYTRLGFADPMAFLSLLAGIVVSIAVIRNVLFVFSEWLSSLYMSLFKHHLSTRLLTTYLAQPYVFFLNRRMSKKSQTGHQMIKLASCSYFTTGHSWRSQ